MLGVRAGPSYGAPQKGSVRLTIFVSALAAAAWIWLLLFSQPRCWETSKDRLLGPPSVSIPSSDPSFVLESQLAVLSPSNHALVGRSRSTSSTGRVMESEGSTLRNIVFGIGASAELWQQRKEYVKLWWRPGELRGYVWLDEPVEMSAEDVGQLPELRVSEDISRFRYTNPKGHPSAIRLSRIVSETVRMQPQGVDWFVMGDDDTIFSPDNLVKVLSKYDHTKMVYVGSSSESHKQNVDFSYQMAFGGGGFALSYPLARALERMQDKCLERHPELFGSDDRMQACVAELGVPLFKEAGFHQFDIYGNAFGLLSAHPLVPFISLHHVDLIEPVFPGRNTRDALAHLNKAMRAEPAAFLQQSFCVDAKRRWTVSVAWGYSVQWFPGVMRARDLERPEVTYQSWHRKADPLHYSFNTRPAIRSPCQRPTVFYMDDIGYAQNSDAPVSVYARDTANDKRKKEAYCKSSIVPPEGVTSVRVVRDPTEDDWFQTPRRQCCKSVTIQEGTQALIRLGACDDGEVIA
ncbi:hypothetical protein KFL_000960180 [Klebsormidium nitens]|uniref:Uncharacterized protein n=1 Tax=Klebsormidium nitens TaxID=105231 RepID=A0A0U9HJD7_KLENI|nr:hypothetical protein KFL_000960180 [Klebsormidium nitens]|eukprot:GAQ81967.1 hypothetical protein KFL_000960180 [Klebsormidium nitens]